MPRIPIIGDGIKKTVYRLYLASIDHLHIQFFFPKLSVKDIRIIALGLEHHRGAIKGERGRPKLSYSRPSTSDRLRILNLFYEGYDVVEIADALKSEILMSESLGQKINHICYFFTDDITSYFGVGECLQCKHHFIYVGDDPQLCASCNMKLYKGKRTEVGKRLMDIDSKPANCIGRSATAPTAFGRTYHPLMRERLINNSLEIHDAYEARSTCRRLSEMAAALSKSKGSSPEYKRFVRNYMPVINELKQTVLSIAYDTNLISDNVISKKKYGSAKGFRQITVQ